MKDENAKEHSESKGQFSTFGVPNGTLKGLNFLWLGFAQRPSGDDKAHRFRYFRKRMRSNSNPNRLYLLFRAL